MRRRSTAVAGILLLSLMDLAPGPCFAQSRWITLSAGNPRTEADSSSSRRRRLDA